MSLDSVALLVSFENYLGISIPDREAETIGTVQEMVNSAAAHLWITDQSTPLKEKVLTKLNAALAQTASSFTPLVYSDLIFNTLDPENEAVWNELSEVLGLRLPKPCKKERGGIKNKLLNAFGFPPAYIREAVTVEHFILAVCAENFETLVNARQISNQYEILVAVSGILVRDMGLDSYEIQPEKSFVSDFGID